MPSQPLRYDAGSHLRWDDPGLTWDGFMPEIPHNNVMPNDNRISVELTEQQKLAFQDAMDAARAVFTDFAINLTPQERQRIQSIGHERSGMLEVFPQEMAANATLVPPFVSADENTKDVNLIRDMMVMRQRVAVLLETIDDIMKVASADAFVAFTAFYASVKEARRRNVPGSDAVYARLAPFFGRNGNNSEPTEPTQPPTP